jgi:hypothetical protein
VRVVRVVWQARAMLARPGGPRRRFREVFWVPADNAGEGKRDWERVQQMAGFFSALGDPECIRLLEFLAAGESTAADCAARTGLPEGRVCEHLATLQRRGWIATAGPSYRLADGRAKELVLLARTLAENNVGALVRCSHLENSPPC